MLIKLENQDISNLNIFLERVELKGTKEAIALMRISQALQAPEKYEVKKEA